MRKLSNRFFDKLYGAYDAAFRRLNRDQPSLGIIHFDPERRWPGDRNIFDYMAGAENLHGLQQQLEKKVWAQDRPSSQSPDRQN